MDIKIRKEGYRMNIFVNNKTEKEFKDFTEKIETIIFDIEELGNKEDINSLKKLVENFKIKTNDFFRENRKLNIGVVGQVKAGKSSFLNTLLFDGKEVFPKASTPKTATLTKMEYSEENIIEIEYYTPEDWEIIRDNAVIEDDRPEYVSAREILEMLKERGLNAVEYLERGRERIKFDTYDELISQLNNYVGEDGKFTPLVKAVVLYLNNDNFKDISIVDTPGLNDPVISRTERTREFIEICDVVFFLSQTGSFLDKSDWDLLSTQLPQKGVKKLVLIGSKYDSGVRDVLRIKKETSEDDPFADIDDDNTADNIPDACQIITRKLKKRAKKQVEKELERKGLSENLANVIRECGNPILVSAMAYNMANKDVSEYNSEEENVFKAISRFSDDVTRDLKLLGNFDAVRGVFYSVVEAKEKILEEKSINFIPTGKEELIEQLNFFTDKANKKLVMLSDNEREEILEQKQAMEHQINGIKAQIISTFGEWSARLESEKVKASGEIRTASKEYCSIEEKTGTKTHVESYTAYSGKFLFFKWGAHTEYYTYEESYTYLAVADAADNLRNFVLEATEYVENIFNEVISHSEMKRKLLGVVADNFNMGDEKYDPALFKIMVENVINKIEFPIIKIDSSFAVDELIANFSGEITSNSEKNDLRNALAKSIDSFFDIMTNELEKSVKNFKESLKTVQENIQNELLENINDEFAEIVEKFENKEKEIENYRIYIKKLENAKNSI